MISPKPQWSFQLLRWYCHPACEEDISGDLEELYLQRQQEMDTHRARWLLFRDVLLLCRPEIIGIPSLTYTTNHTAMFRSYFTITLRSLQKNKLYGLINTISLAIAMSVSMLIAIYVSYDLSFDQFHPHKERIYRITTDIVDSEWAWAKTFAGLGEKLRNDYAEVEDFTRIYTRTESGVVVQPDQNSEDKYIEEKSYYVDPNIFDFFDLPLVSGNPNRLLQEPQQVLISSEIAEKYFGNIAPATLVDHTISITDGQEQTKLYKISGIFRKIPNAHFRPDLLISINTIPQQVLEEYGGFSWADAYTYLKLNDNAHLPYLKHEIDSICHALAWGSNFSFDNEIQSLTEIHHQSHYDDEMEAGGNLTLNYFLLGVAAFILICAWVNYINMAIAKAASRAKEVGVRKALGALRGNIIIQFLLEGFWLNLSGGVVALLITIVFLQITGNAYLHMGLAWPWQIWIKGQPSLLLFFLLWLSLIGIGTLLSSIYPSFLLSSFSIARIFKGMRIRYEGGVSLRQGLLVFQFFISALLIVGIYAATNQLAFMLNKELGFEKEQKFIIAATFSNVNNINNYLPRAKAFKNEMRTIPGVTDLTTSCSVPGKPPLGTRVLTREGPEEGDFGVDIVFNGGPSTGIIVGPNFFQFYGIGLKAGQWFPSRVFEDSSLINKYVLVNEKFAVANGFDPPETIIGKTIWGQYKVDEREAIEVIGLVENHHHFSVKEDFMPLVFTPEGATHFQRASGIRTPHEGTMKFFSIKLQMSSQPAQQIAALISQIEKQWNAYFPELAFDYFFLDDAFNQQYETDIRISRLFSMFAALSIFISCLGLFGLSSYLIEQRTKEIGIRKVLGASLHHLFSLLSSNYIRLVTMASLIAIPVAWWGIHYWLESYAFRIQVQWWFFVLPLLCLLLIALMTISFKVLHTATANPVESLRYE